MKNKLLKIKEERKELKRMKLLLKQLILQIKDDTCDKRFLIIKDGGTLSVENSNMCFENIILLPKGKIKLKDNFLKTIK